MTAALVLGLGGAGAALAPPSAGPSALRDEAGRLSALLRDRGFSEADAEVDRLLRERPLSRNGRRLLEEVYSTLEYDSSIEAPVEAWCASGRSHACFVVRGLQRLRSAWEARGTGWAETVEPAAWPEFERWLRLARADLEEAARRRPDDPNAAAALITVAKGQGSPREAMEAWFRAALRADAAASRAYRAKMAYLLPKWNGSEEEAELFAAECERMSPPGSIVYAVRLDWLEEQAARSQGRKAFWTRPDTSQAVDRVLTRWLRDFPSSTEARTRLARVRAASGDPASALRLYDEALSIDPEHAELLTFRADLRRKEGDVAGAEADYRRSLALQPDIPAGLHGLAMIEAYDRHHDAAALVLLRRAAESRSVQSESLVELGRAWARQGDVPAALEAYDRAIRKAGTASAYMRRGMALWPTDRARARDDLKKAISLGGSEVRERAERFSTFMAARESGCEAGDPTACLALARRYAEGDQVPLDMAKAGVYRQRACRLGKAEACTEGQAPP